MDLALEHKVAIVTGASRGLGRGMAERLLAEGCRVVACARTESELAAAVRDMDSQAPGRVHAVVADVTHPASAKLLIAQAQERFGGLDIVVNNAGGNRRKPFIATTDEDWNDLYQLNVVSGVRLAREAVPALRARGGGAIVFITSLFGREGGGPTLSLYNATKSAAMSAAKIIALELAPEKIRVNSVAPGSIRYPGGSWDKRALADPAGIAKFVHDNLPLGRFGSVEEVADTVAFLVSPRASLITGACIAVDGSQGHSLI